MFGVLKGSRCGMRSADREQWMGHVCGVCLSLRDGYGHASRIATNYDAALISVLCEAQSPNPQEKQVSRCPLRSPFKAAVYSPGNPGTQFAALMSLVAALTRIEDHVRDGESFLRHIPGIAARVARKWRQAARRVAQALEFNVNVIEAQTRRQGQIEAQPDRDFFFYARPTALSVGAVFRHTAVVAGRPHNADILYEIGRLFGRIVYLLDSYRDYAGDLSSNKFNALAACFAREETQRQAAGIFRQALHEIERLFGQLDLPRPSLARVLLTRQLERTGCRTLKTGACTACSRCWSGGSKSVAIEGIALAGRDSEQQPQEGQPINVNKGERRRKCPYCGQAVDRDSVICGHCGRAISSPSELSAERDPVKDPDDGPKDELGEKAQLIATLLQAVDAPLRFSYLANQHKDKIDSGFFRLLTAQIKHARQSAQTDMAEKLTRLRKVLLERLEINRDVASKRLDAWCKGLNCCCECIECCYELSDSC